MFWSTELLSRRDSGFGLAWRVICTSASNIADIHWQARGDVGREVVLQQAPEAFGHGSQHIPAVSSHRGTTGATRTSSVEQPDDRCYSVRLATNHLCEYMRMIYAVSHRVYKSNLPPFVQLRY